MAKSRTLRVGIVGSGFGLYGLLPAFRSLKNCHVVALAGKQTERVIRECSQYGVGTLYENWKEMLEKENLDAVALAVVPSAQFEVAHAALQKGLHIFAEKPLTNDVTKARLFVQLAKKKKVTTAVDFIFPEIDVWQKTKQLIDEKKYGALLHVQVNWQFWSYDLKNHVSTWKTDVKQGGGVLSFFGSHTLYYLEYFAGEVKKMCSQFQYSKESANGGEVVVDIVVQCKSGVHGNIHIACNSKGMNQHSLIFQCEKATLLLENKNHVTEEFVLTIKNENGKEKKIVSKKWKKSEEDERVATVQKLAEKFVNACLTHQSLVPSFQEGLRVQELIERVREAQM